MARVQTVVTGRWRENCHIVAAGEDAAVVIDPGADVERIEQALAGRRVLAVVNTHAHYDHVGAVAPLQAGHGAPFHLHPADRGLLRRANFYRALFLGEETITVPEVDEELADGQELVLGPVTLGVVHTPGHTEGSVCLSCDGDLFSGDTIMARHVGRTDLPEGDRDRLMASIGLLAERFPPETRLYPGHGEEAVLGEVLSRLDALEELTA